ncbi:MAG TPA: ABC transporter permease [Chitinophagaceae bacterium]
MIRNYLLIAIRNFWKHKIFSMINIAGLAVSMSLCLLIITVISDLLSYDNFHSNRDNIYRVITKVQSGPGYTDMKATCPFPVANELEENFQGYENITRIQRFFNAKAESNNREIQLEGYFTEPSFLKMFSFPLLKGNIQTALVGPNSIILTERSAEKFFGKEDPVGKVVSMGLFGNYIITGIISDPPENSHLKFDVLGSLSSLGQMEKDGSLDPDLNEWSGFLKNYVYIQKSQDLSIKQIRDDLKQIALKSTTLTKDLQLSFQLQSLDNIVPGPDLSSQIGPKMGYLPILILSGVALLILISACINYTNLSLARALSRAKEVGIRKAIGGSKKQLFTQFLAETIIVCLLSLVAAYLIFGLIRPGFLKVVPRASEMFSLKVSPLLVLFFIGFAFFTAMIAGILPASVLSRFNVIRALKNDTTINSLGRVSLRKALIIFQFTLSMIFIVGVIVVYRQYHFSRNYDHGFTIKNKMVIPLEGVDYKLLKNEFGKNPGVSSVTGSSVMVGSFQTNTTVVKLPENIDSLSADYLHTDENFIDDLDIKLLAGHAFTNTGKSKEHSVVINEQLAQAIGAKQPQAALGRSLLINDESMEIIGVVKNFNYAQLEEPIRNFIFFYEPGQVGYAYLSFSGKFNDAVNSSLEKSWSNIAGSTLFQGKKMEVVMEETYSFYTNFIKIFGFVALLAITIGCLGLVGMSLYAARSRLKEVGIRKVLGASVGNILLSLSKGFLWLLLIASAIALPISYFLFNIILENGVHHIQIGVIELGSGLLILLLVGGITIISQIWRTALANPVKSLRTE